MKLQVEQIILKQTNKKQDPFFVKNLKFVSGLFMTWNYSHTCHG